MFIFEHVSYLFRCFFFFFNDTATTEIYTLSLHDALPIFCRDELLRSAEDYLSAVAQRRCQRSEEHTSELQSLAYLVCRLLLEKKKNWRNARRLPATFQKPPPVTADHRTK